MMAKAVKTAKAALECDLEDHTSCIKESREHAAARVEQRYTLVKEFLAEESEFIDCPNCGSTISREYAQRRNTWVGQARCIVCNESLLPEKSQELLHQWWKEGVTESDFFRERHPQFDLADYVNGYRPVSPESCYSWTSLLPKKTLCGNCKQISKHPTYKPVRPEKYQPAIPTFKTTGRK